MFTLFKYIVILFFSFNMLPLNAAEVIFDPIDSDEETEPLIASFTGAASLPHPVQLRQIINQPGNSPLGKLAILAQYFDARYPGDISNIDFKEDVALIFPEMSPDEVEKTTNYIKTAFRIYRLGKEKLNEIKEKKLAPKDPPLIVDDDEYALVGDREYIETEDDQVAVISDFKKVIGYGHNPKELEAIEARAQKLLRQKKKNTDFERLRMMMEKIEWSNLTAYGVTKPSPFVGNAGIGTWVDKDSYRARILSDTARIGSSKQLMLGLHIKVPDHRFMLASTLSDHLTKPKIELIKAENIASYEIFYPLPVQAVSKEMIATYRGDFAFPIQIVLKEENTPVDVEAKLTFQNCDPDFECQEIVLEPSIQIDAEDGEVTYSSMSNFIHQSFYNLPKTKDKHLSLENVSYQTNEDGAVSKINLEFEYRSKIKNFALFLENDDNTTFQTPDIITDYDRIYAQIVPLKNVENLLKKPLTLTVRLNDYSALKQTFDLNDFQSSSFASSLTSLLWLGFWVALLFYITPFGFSLMLPTFLIQEGNKTTLSFVLSKALYLALFLTVFAWQMHLYPEFLYFDPSSNVFYLALVFFLICIQLFDFQFHFITNTKHPLTQAFVSAVLIAIIIPFAPLAYTQEFLTKIQNVPNHVCLVALFGFFIGLITPDFLALYVNKKSLYPKMRQLALLFAKTLLLLAMLIIVLHLIFLLTLTSCIKIFLFLSVGLLFLKHLFYFWTALYKTNLKPSYISGTEKVLFFTIPFLVLLFSYATERLSVTKMGQTDNITHDFINEQLNKGESLIVAFQSPSCLICKFNDLTVFNKRNLKKLKESYNLQYIPVVNIQPSLQTIEFLKQYKRLRRPLYVFYSATIPSGAVLPDWIIEDNLSKTFNNFNLYSDYSPPSSKVFENKRKIPFR